MKIEKCRKRSIDILANGDKAYTINTHGVLCARSPLNDGTKRNWYSYTLDTITGSLKGDRELILSLAKGCDHIGFYFE